MIGLLDVLLRISLPLAVGHSACVLLRHRSATVRHAVLAAAVLAAWLVVPLSWVVPAWTVPINVLPVPTATTSVVTEVDAVVADGDPRAGRGPGLSAAAVLWASGTLATAALLFLGLARLVRITVRARRITSGPWVETARDVAAAYGIRRPVALKATNGSGVLAAWGILRPCVLLPSSAEEWDEARIRTVLCHELAHVRRGDWLVQMGAELLCAVFWFSPFCWMVRARLRRESEQACDDAVLAAGIPASDYALRLVDIAAALRASSRASWLSAMPMARSSTLEGRITAMLDQRLDRRVASRRTVGTVVVVMLATLVTAASVRAQTQSGPGTLSGHVYDRSGAVLPEVTVTLIDAQQVRWPTTTDRSGGFSFSPIGSGEFMIEASLAGFRSLSQKLTLTASSNATTEITLQVGELEETITVTAKRPQATNPAPRERAAEPLRVGGNIKPPRKVGDVRPVYPPSMVAAGLEGRVPMEALIGVDGSVVSVRMLSAQVHPYFAAAAEEAVRQWKFTPTLLNGVAVEVRMVVSVQFSLSD